MKNLLIILFLILMSCNKEYEYMEISKQYNLLTGSTETETKTKIIKAKNDAEAYYDAYTRFYIAKKMFEKDKKKYGNKENFRTYINEPLKFKLINEENENIAILPDFNDMETRIPLIEKVVDNMKHLQ